MADVIHQRIVGGNAAARFAAQAMPLLVKGDDSKTRGNKVAGQTLVATAVLAQAMYDADRCSRRRMVFPISITPRVDVLPLATIPLDPIGLVDQCVHILNNRFHADTTSMRCGECTPDLNTSAVVS